MKLFSFLFHHKSNSFLSICALLLFLSSPITLYAAEENTVVIEESPATQDITVEVSEEIHNDTSQTEVPAVDSTQETITIETPSVDAPETLLPAPDTALPDTQDSIVNNFTVEPFDGTYYVISSGGLNVRKGPSKNYDIIGSLSYGKEILVTGKVESDWFEISYQGAIGYISAKYVSSEPVTANSLHTEETANTPESTSEEADTNHELTPFLDNIPMLLLLLAIIVVVILLIITVFSFFRNSGKNDYEDYDDESYDDSYDYDNGSYNDSDEYDDDSYDDSDEYDDNSYDSDYDK